MSAAAAAAALTFTACSSGPVGNLRPVDCDAAGAGPCMQRDAAADARADAHPDAPIDAGTDAESDGSDDGGTAP